MSQWPRGLFRRAYLRDYAAAIGTPAEPLIAEFTRLYPEDGPPVSAADLAEAAEPLRLSFPSAAEAGPLRPFEPLSAAGAELLVVVVIGLGIALLRGFDPLTTCGLVALVYYPAGHGPHRPCAVEDQTAVAAHRPCADEHQAAVAATRAGARTAPAAEPATLYLMPKPAPLPLVALGTEEEAAAATTRHQAAV